MIEKSTEKYNDLLKCYKEKGYQIHTVSCSHIKRLFFCLVMFIPFIFVFAFIYNFIWDNHVSIKTFVFWLRENPVEWFLSILIISLIHEPVHAFIYGLFCKNKYKSVELGMDWKQMYSYTYVNEAIPLKSYVLGLMLPFLLSCALGTLSIVTGSFLIFWSAFVMMLISGDDFAILLLILEFHGKKDYIIASPISEVSIISKN